MPRPVRRFGLAALACLTSSCQVWAVEPGPVPVTLATSPLPNQIRLTTADGRRMIVEVPRVAGDSVFGVQRGRTENAVPIDAITKVERRQIDGGRTAAAVLVVGGSVALIAVMLHGLSEIEDCGYAGCP
ncbi:MAG: hypothetical protein OEW80_00940 [Gemmatimonadota bacterium]|nr:hypothetical protein [Gemmatimonadota bacterium]